MSATKTTERKRQNGSEAEQPERSPLAEAITCEQQIAELARELWANPEVELDHHWLLREFRPLLRRPIPAGFIETVGKTEGKPYPSTGVKSVQVQIDRLDNVLGPDNWGYEATYTEGGKLCHVRAWIGPKEKPLVLRDSYGGSRGNNLGNTYKGSFTNAAKLALARLGPGWEVYVGAADFDPDTDKDAADVQAADQAPEIARIDGERVAALVDLAQAWVEAEEGEDEQKERQRNLAILLGKLGARGGTITERIANLTPVAAEQFEAELRS